MVAILLPLTGLRGDVGQSMLHAAELALAAPGAPVLLSKDTGGTPEGAAAAARASVAAGAGLILGPLTSAETMAVAPIARGAGIAVLAFTNDPAQAQPGVWTLGITPAQQVRRLVGAVQDQGKDRFAALVPDNAFGHAMEQGLLQAASGRGMGTPTTRSYAPGAGMGAITAAVRDISDYANRRGPLDARVRAARAAGGAEGRQAAAEMGKASVPPPPMDALLLAYFDIDRGAVRILGPAQWADPSTQSGQFPGAWYAAPDPAARAEFVAAYTAKYGTAPTPVADLAVDAAAIARLLAAGPGFSVAGLTAPSGFAGVDGPLALQSDGQVRRALAVFEVQRGGAQMVAPAPQSFAAPGS
jgi:branched-chain amino acid transport system substrate-binding protein